MKRMSNGGILMGIAVGGDNPYASTDSRIFGAIRKEDIIGKILLS